MTAAFGLALAGLLTAATPAEPLESIEALTAGLARDYGIKVAWQPAQTVPPADVALDWADQDDLGRLLDYLAWFDQEWRKYPRALVSSSGLRELLFVEAVDYGDGERTAYPGYDIEVLIYQFPEPDDGDLESYYRHVIHHEFFHMLEEQWNGDGYYHDPEWAALNRPAFRYGDGVTDEQLSNPPTHPSHGFVSHYAMSAMEEDRAEVWSLMLVRDGWRKLAAWRRDDTILAAKVALLEALAASRCPTVDATWWRELRVGWE